MIVDLSTAATQWKKNYVQVMTVQAGDEYPNQLRLCSRLQKWLL